MDDYLSSAMINIINGTNENQTQHVDNMINTMPQGYTHTSAETNSDKNLAKHQRQDVTTGKTTTWRIIMPHSNNQSKNSTSRYTTLITIGKSDTSVNALFDAVQAAIEASCRKFGNDFAKKAKSPIHDGDNEFPANADPDNYRGKFYVYARSYDFPAIFDIKGKRLNGESLQVNSQTQSNNLPKLGEGSAHITFYPYSNSGMWGVSCSTKALLFIKTPTSLSPASMPEEEAVNFAKNVFSQFIEK